MSEWVALELALTGRSTCRLCGTRIALRKVRVVVGPPRPFFYHPRCALGNRTWWETRLESYILAAAGMATDEVRSQMLAELDPTDAIPAHILAELTVPRPTVRLLAGRRWCAGCHCDLPPGTRVVLVRPGVLHPACVTGWLDAHGVAPEHWLSALRTNCSGEDLDLLTSS